MLIRNVVTGAGVLSFLALLTSASAIDYGLNPATVELTSAGPLTFTPDGVLIIGDPKAATIYAIEPEESSSSGAARFDIPDFRTKVAQAVGTPRPLIADVAIHPETGSLYASVQTAKGAAIARVTADGLVSAVDLDKVLSSKVHLPNPPEDREVGRGGRTRNLRLESITDLAIHDGRLLVSGLSAKDSPSTVLEFEFPLNENSRSFYTEIYHAAHGRVEDNAAIRSFIPINIGGEPSLLAGFTCTPLVRFPMHTSGTEAKVRGKTVAELGNRNRPLDMVLYTKDDQEYLLITNSARGVMRLKTDNIDQQEGLSQRVQGGGTAGLPFEQVDGWDGVIQLAKLDQQHAVVVIEDGNQWQLKTLPLP